MKYSAKKLTAQYALTQAAYWMVFCGLYTFATVYLLSKGLTSSKIGIIVACGNLLGFVLQPYISGLADRFQNLTLHYLVEVLIGVMVLAILLLLLLPDVFVLIFLLYVIADALLQVLQPLLNSLSIYYVNAGINVDFGIARGMGSLSFAIMSSVLGVMCDKFGANVSMISAILLLIAVFCLVLSMPVIKACDEQKRDKSSNQSSKQKMGIVSFLMHYKRFSMVLFASVLVFIFHNSVQHLPDSGREGNRRNVDPNGNGADDCCCLRASGNVWLFADCQKVFKCQTDDFCDDYFFDQGFCDLFCRQCLRTLCFNGAADVFICNHHARFGLLRERSHERRASLYRAGTDGRNDDRQRRDRQSFGRLHSGSNEFSRDAARRMFHFRFRNDFDDDVCTK